MARWYWATLFLAITTIGIACLASPPVVADTKKTSSNQQQPISLPDSPERQQQLLKNWQAFRQLSTAKQEAMRSFDRELHALPQAKRLRVERLLERYVAWLDRLTDEQRREILQSPTPQERLRRIAVLRETDWLNKLYPEEREAFLHMPAGEDRDRRRRALQIMERERQRDWQIAYRNFDDLAEGRLALLPAALADYPPPQRAFINDFLRPMLSKEEEQRLQRVDSRWPTFPRVVVELADRHPIYLPGKADGPKTVRELPDELRRRFQRRNPIGAPMGAFGRLRAVEGKWPEFAIAVTELAKQREIEMPLQLGPAAPNDFPPRVQRFIQSELIPLLSAEEKIRLEKAQGAWPAYPRALLVVASKHGLQFPPGDGARLSLPGPPELWNRYRLQPMGRSPDLPDQLLQAFARQELAPERRFEMPLLSFDPLSRETLKRAYFERHPLE